MIDILEKCWKWMMKCRIVVKKWTGCMGFPEDWTKRASKQADELRDG